LLNEVTPSLTLGPRTDEAALEADTSDSREPLLFIPEPAVP
jgi:hypothetical protein